MMIDIDRLIDIDRNFDFRAILKKYPFHVLKSTKGDFILSISINFVVYLIKMGHVKKNLMLAAIIGEIGIDSIIKGFKEGAENIFRNIPCLMR